MEFDPLLIAVFALASIGGTALLIFAIRSGGKTKAAQEELAQRNGWQYHFIPGSGPSGSSTIFEDTSEGWSLTLYSGRSSNSTSSSSSTIRWSQFEDRRSKIDQGMAVLGPDIPEKTAAMADKMMGLMGGDIGKFFLDKITGGLGEEAQGLRTVPSDAPGHLMASPGAEDALDAVRDDPDLLAARSGVNEMQQPIVMRGPFGTRLRVSRLLRKPEEIEAFIELGRKLCR